MQRIEDGLNKVEWLLWILKKIKETLSIYFDLFKDVYLLCIILITIGGFQALVSFPTKLTSVLVYSLSASIIIPIVFSSLSLALQRVEEEKLLAGGGVALLKKMAIISKTLSISVMNPLGRVSV